MFQVGLLVGFASNSLSLVDVLPATERLCETVLCLAGPVNYGNGSHLGILISQQVDLKRPALKLVAKFSQLSIMTALDAVF